MEPFAIALFASAVIVIPIAILLYSEHGKKRGCGRGCAACGNRDICYRKKQQKPDGDTDRNFPIK